MRLFTWRVCVFVSLYFLVLIMEIYYWPRCVEDSFESDLDLELPPIPSNLLHAPMWNSLHPSGGCGKWIKVYNKLHKEILSGKRPPSYLVYTTGRGFMPHIESVPHAMKGIGTVFMMALLTDRAFILDWKSPNGMESFLNPLKIDWRSDTLFKDGLPQKYVHDIGGPYWFEDQGKNVQWYTNTNLNRYFSEDIEIVQGHSYDFTYALLRNRHHQEKIAQYGLHEVRCLLCCFWNNLFTFAPSLQRSMFNFLRRIQWSKTHDIIFVNVQIPNQHSSSRGHELQFGQSIVQCTEKAIRNLKLKKPVWILSSNSFVLLEGLMKSSHFQKEGRVYSKERYTVDIKRENATKTHTMILPRTEQNALYQFVTGYFLQLNSTVLVSDYRSVYAESMAAYRHFLHPGRYVVYHDNGCHLQRYGN